MWIKNQTIGYKNLDIKNFDKASFGNGLALCALIHKFRPGLVDYDKLNPANALDNIKAAMNAAEKYFGLERYIKEEDFIKICADDKVFFLALSQPTLPLSVVDFEVDF